MHVSRAFLFVCTILSAVSPLVLAKNHGKHFGYMDVFELERATDPQFSPDGRRIVYVRTFMDKMKDLARSSLWVIDADGQNHRPLSNGASNDVSPRWSPDGTRLAFLSDAQGSTQLYIRWMDTGQTARLTSLTEPPDNISWSPDGRWLAFSQRVPAKPGQSLADLPAPPEGAEWAKPPIQIESLNYRVDGAGYLKEEYAHIFVIPSVGGTARQVTSGNFNHEGTPAWARDGQFFYISANRSEEPEFNPLNTDIFRVSVANGTMQAMTKRNGPDTGVVVSPDGAMIAYVGFDDQGLSYQVNNLYVKKISGGEKRLLIRDFDRNVANISWSGDGKGLYFTFDDQGVGKLAYIPLDVKGEMELLAENVAGGSLGRPYGGGWYSTANNGDYVYTLSSPQVPCDLNATTKGQPKRITNLNEDLLGHKTLAEVEEVRYSSSFDGREIQGWIARPPNFDPKKKYPLILEIHGGPFSDYGPRFSAEVQLYAAAGYVVLYTNPRGSTSYGQAFANLIHHDYPNHDYDDLMSGVDMVIARGFVDPDRLFVTGGSGGGVLTAWIVGKTNRFRAAVSAKPVINWYSFALTSDLSAYFIKYWFPDKPWENPEHYMKYSPLSLVGNVTTPTMLLTGESDYRTPISESEQYYKALKLQRVDTAMIRIPETSHGIAARPSRLIAKVAYILGWFECYDVASTR